MMQPQLRLKAPAALVAVRHGEEFRGQLATIDAPRTAPTPAPPLDLMKLASRHLIQPAALTLAIGVALGIGEVAKGNEPLALLMTGVLAVAYFAWRFR